MARPADTASLIERADLVSGVLDALSADTGAGVLIIGAAGTGKTAALKAVLREHRPGDHVIRLTATQTLAAVPFGALAPYLGNVPANDLDSHAAVLSGMTETLKSEPDPPLFVIDDAHYLDRSTARGLACAAATGSARIMATSRPGTMIPEEFLMLWSDGLLAKFTLGPLSLGGTHQLCEQVLRGSVSPWVSARFHDAVAGNPLMLTSLIRHARDSGMLGRRHGVWFLLSGPELAEVPASDVLDQQLRSMSPEAMTAATIVALAGPLPLGQVLRFSGPRAVDALDIAGIITVSDGTDREVRPASSIVGEIIRHRVPAARSSALRTNILGLASTGDVRPEARMNRLRWSMDCGASIPSGQLVDAAEAANAALDPAAAARAAATVDDALFLPEARIQLAYSHYLLGRADAAAGCLRAALPLNHVRSLYLASLLAVRLAQAAATQRPEPGANGSGVSLSGSRGPADRARGYNPGPDITGLPWTLSPAAGMAADTLLRGWDRPFPAVAAGLRDLAEAYRSVPEIRFPVISQLAELLTAQGRLLSGLQLDHEAWLGARDACRVLPLVYEDMVSHHCLNLIRAGHWNDLGGVLDSYAASMPGRLLYSGGMLHLMRGYSQVRQGRMREGLSELGLADEELLIADPLNLGPFAHAVAAYAAACAGRPHTAQAHALAYYRTGYGEPRTLRLLAEAYCRAAASWTAPGPDTGDNLQALAVEARSQGLISVEADIRRLALRCGDTRQAPGLAACGARMDGVEARLLVKYAYAVEAADAEPLMDISDDALAAGHPLLALEAAEQAGRLMDKAPERWKQTPVQRRVNHRLIEAGIAAHLQGGPGIPGTALTGREREIRDLVISGATNAEIATVLGVSPRTVAGHISHLLAKLGVRRRAEIRGEDVLNS